jgi:hypothetical protein
MAVDRHYTIEEVAFNSVTYNSAVGGPLSFRWGHRGNRILDRTADDIYSPSVIVPERDITVSVRFRDPVYLENPGAIKSDLRIKVKVAGRPDTAKNITFSNMVFVSIESHQERSIPGECELFFEHEHTTASTIAEASA